ncbi:hypothetical protein [Myceligenerans pegani]|uniref:Uncharacterized protein n=1 Tax=Myceligenerans pegani TaxID=2776917 RepID=A0ABR9MTH7_9MICO|nr:hypothetical protein [Myceligenerans sp. TRM 65318]MBE1874361.1 hypothetical protein [Myceligenerans sp. TRM 65318]MBE3016632.1 hypothetical protein [Myceligenerans sp. TRM 65318]
MSDNRHEPDEARENENRPEGVGEHPGTGETQDDVTEVIENGSAARPDGVAEAPDNASVPETERIEIGQDAGLPVSGGPEGGQSADAVAAGPPPAGAAGTQPVPAGAAYGESPYDRPGAPHGSGGQGVPPATAVPPVGTVQHPNVAARQPAPPQGPRVGTVVWGLVVLAIGLGVLAASAGARIDVSLAAILLLGGAGIALVAGSIVSSFRRRGEP